MVLDELTRRLPPSAELGRHLPAIDKERRTRDVRCLVRRQEYGGSRYFFGVSTTPQWNVAEVLAKDVRIVEGLLRQPGPDQDVE